jgi:hypothetical protein
MHAVPSPAKQEKDAPNTQIQKPLKSSESARRCPHDAAVFPCHAQETREKKGKWKMKQPPMLL